MGSMYSRLIVAAFLFVVSSTVNATGLPLASGTMTVTVVDETGRKASAQIYLYDLKRQAVVTAPSVRGAASLTLPEGAYLIYAAQTKPSVRYVNHYASFATTVQVAPHDDVCVILSLHRAEIEDVAQALTEATRRKIGLSDNASALTLN